MSRLASIVYTKDDYLVFYSAGEFVTRGRSPQHYALAGNLIKHAERVSVVDGDNGMKTLKIEGQRNG